MKTSFLILLCFLFFNETSFSQEGKSAPKYVRILPAESGEKEVNKEQELSDVNLDIPKNKKQFEHRIALIIGNEKYSKYGSKGVQIDVDYAENDAEIFKLYCERILGVKNENLFLLKNATSAEMNRYIKKVEELSKVYGDDCEILFYYAGHGLPDEKFKSTYLIPVDVDAGNLESGIELSSLYRRLAGSTVKRLTVFLDACFSGGARNQGLIASRGIVPAVPQAYIQGKTVVFSASSADESALPYNERKHGIFTYYLLKKLKETKGNVTYEALAQYLEEQVKITSIRIAKKQTPKVMTSVSIKDDWKKYKMN